LLCEAIDKLDTGSFAGGVVDRDSLYDGVGANGEVAGFFGCEDSERDALEVGSSVTP